MRNVSFISMRNRLNLMSVNIRISIMQVLVSHPENVCLISGENFIKQ